MPDVLGGWLALPSTAFKMLLQQCGGFDVFIMATVCFRIDFLVGAGSYSPFPSFYLFESDTYCSICYMPLWREAGESNERGSAELVIAGGVLATRRAVSVGDSLPRIIITELALTSTTASLLITIFIFMDYFCITLSLGK